MTNKQKILIAHSDDDLTTLLQLMLEDDFDISLYTCAKEVKNALESERADLVLLDTQLHDIDGLQVCLWIKENFPESKLPVIFLSNDSDETVIRQAYANGAYDYLCLPVNIVAFHSHIVRFAAELESLRALEERDKAGSSITETAMKQASFYGQGLELVSALNYVYSEQEIAMLVGKTFKALGISCILQFRSENGAITLEADGEASDEMVTNIFELLKQQGRIYHFGRRCIFNDEHVSVLIKTMPKEGTSSYDAVLDMVAKFVPALEARLIGLYQHRNMETTKTSLMEIMQLVNDSFTNMQVEKLRIIENLETQISMSFGSLDLQEYQEKAIVKLIDKEIRSKMQNDSFAGLKNKVDACIQSVRLQSPKQSTQQNPTSANTDDVELF